MWGGGKLSHNERITIYSIYQSGRGGVCLGVGVGKEGMEEESTVQGWRGGGCGFERLFVCCVYGLNNLDLHSICGGV